MILAAALVATVTVVADGPASAAEPSEVVVVGGPAVISNGVFNHLKTCAADGATRLAGSDRYATAAAVADRFGSANTVFLATGLNFPDAIAAGPVAALNGSPILLVKQNWIPPATNDALQRLSPTRIVILGGPAVIGAGIEDQLRARFSEVVRLAGPHRYATAVAISEWQFPDPAGVDVVHIAVGTKYLDALVAGPPATRANGPLLLVAPDEIHDVTAAELTRLDPTKIVVLGSSAVVHDSVFAALGAYADTVERVAGSSRYSTAAEVAGRMPQAGRAYVVTADKFPDGLTATPLANGDPILYASYSRLHEVTASAIARHTGTSCRPWSPPFPQVGTGKRIIYGNSAQRVWLVDANEQLVDTYLVSGKRGVPNPGTYRVFSKSVNAWGPGGTVTMKHMVRYTWGNRYALGFHSIPRRLNGTPIQTEAQLGTFRSAGCTRQADHKAKALYYWAPIGTKVIVLR
jgi:putative cell wall-binding protein